MIRTIFATAAILVLAGCASSGNQLADAAPTPLDQFPLAAVHEADETVLAVHSGGVSANQVSVLAGMTGRWREAGGEMIHIRAPRGGPAEGTVYTMAESVRVALLEQGVAAENIVVEGYNAPGDARAPVVVSFQRYLANIPKCGQTWDNLTATRDNNVSSNFGCAVSANMAAMIANPADIVQARAMDPADAGRRSVVLDLYRRGQVTSSAPDTRASGTVSQAVK